MTKRKRNRDDQVGQARDFVMARLAVAINAFDAAKTSCLAAIDQFISPLDEPEDKNGHLRKERLDDAFMCCHTAADAIDKSIGALGSMNQLELCLGEDDDEEEGEEG